MSPVSQRNPPQKVKPSYELTCLSTTHVLSKANRVSLAQSSKGSTASCRSARKTTLGKRDDKTDILYVAMFTDIKRIPLCRVSSIHNGSEM